MLFMLAPQADAPKVSAALSSLHGPGRQGPVFVLTAFMVFDICAN